MLLAPYLFYHVLVKITNRQWSGNGAIRKKFPLHKRKGYLSLGKVTKWPPI